MNDQKCFIENAVVQTTINAINKQPLSNKALVQVCWLMTPCLAVEAQWGVVWFWIKSIRNIITPSWDRPVLWVDLWVLTVLHSLPLNTFLSFTIFWCERRSRARSDPLFCVLKRSFAAYVAWSWISGDSGSCRESIVGIPEWLGLFHTVAFPFSPAAGKHSSTLFPAASSSEHTHRATHTNLTLQNKCTKTHTCSHCFSGQLLRIVFTCCIHAVQNTPNYYGNILLQNIWVN